MLDIEHLDHLAAAFSVLGRFHRSAPDEQTLSAFWGLLDEWPLPITDATADGLARLRQSRADGEPATVIGRDLAGLYGHMAVARVAPFESVHRGIERLVFDEQTLEVRTAYRALSLQAPRLNKEPDDHIGLEFDFIAQASLRALDALDAGDRERARHYTRIGADFLNEHLQQWAPDMLAQVVEKADTKFMQGIALLSLGALESYAALLAEIPD